jgi:hypothetical protein
METKTKVRKYIKEVLEVRGEFDYIEVVIQSVTGKQIALLLKEENETLQIIDMATPNRHWFEKDWTQYDTIKKHLDTLYKQIRLLLVTGATEGKLNHFEHYAKIRHLAENKTIIYYISEFVRSYHYTYKYYVVQNGQIESVTHIFKDFKEGYCREYDLKSKYGFTVREL